MIKNYQNYKGIHVLSVYGSDYEMGYQHGKLLKDFIKEGPLPYFSNYLERIIKGAGGKLTGKLIGKSLEKTVGKKIASSFPKEVISAFQGLADGADMPYPELIKAVVMPESFLWLSSKALKFKKPEKAPRFMVPFMGCSRVIALGSATKENKLLHGRNFDYQGTGVWDRQTAVIFHQPDKGQLYASVSSAGILLGGVTAMNEAGLTLAVHQHLASDAFTLGGLPIGVIGDQVMRYSENLQDAVKILDSHIPIGCWTYIISSARENKVLCYEVTPSDRSWFISENETFGYSNLFLNKKLADTEYFMYPSQWRSNTGRYHCIQDRLEKNTGNIDENTIAAILGEKNNPSCRLHAPLAMLLTVGSTVFSPSDSLFYVGSGNAPTSNRPFVAFDLKNKKPAYDLADLTGGIPKDSDSLNAFDYYRESFEAYFNKDDLDMARMKLDKALNIKPDEPLYNYIGALLAISDHDFTYAVELLTQTILKGHISTERVASFYFWRGRAFDSLNRRKDAISDYSMAVSGDPEVNKAAIKGLSKKWQWKKLNIEFNYADVINP